MEGAKDKAEHYEALAKQLHQNNPHEQSKKHQLDNFASYSRLCTHREEYTDGVGPWITLKQDKFWWGSRDDWQNPNGHKEVWFPHITERKVAVQAGGWLGLYPRLLSEYFDVVYTFEPDPLSFFVLTQNCQRDNIVKFQAALGSSHGMIAVKRNVPDNPGMNTVVTGGAIPTFMIDDLNLPALNLIALDLEGYEEEALKGAKESIEKFSPVIAAEHGERRVGTLMKEMGYEIVGYSGHAETVFVKHA